MDTLDEVREILRKIGISQAEAAEQHNRDMAELRRSQAKTDEQLAEFQRSQAEAAEQHERDMAELRRSQARTDEQLARTDQQLAQNSKDIANLLRSQEKTDAQLLELHRSQAKTDEQLAKTDARLNTVAQLLGNIGISNGDFAEELFFNSLYANPFLGGLRYDSVKRNVSNRRRNRDEGEYDIVMYNGDTVALIEVKYKAHINDIDELLTKEPQNFRKTFTEYKDYKFYLGLASTVTYDKLITEAREAGIFLLTQRGQHIEVVNEEVHSF